MVGGGELGFNFNSQSRLCVFKEFTHYFPLPVTVVSLGCSRHLMDPLLDLE